MPTSPPVTLLTPEQCLAQLERCAARFAQTVRVADPGTTVPTCPTWTLADLVAHAGGTHLWARDVIRLRRAISDDDLAAPPDPTDAARAADWYTEAAAALAGVLRATDPDTGCWNFGPKPRMARFWFRRQAHEIAVHLTDAQAATGGAPTTGTAWTIGTAGTTGTTGTIGTAWTSAPRWTASTRSWACSTRASCGWSGSRGRPGV